MQAKASHKATQKFVTKWWDDDQNRLDGQIPEWMDEVTRTGDLFILFSVDQVSGMTYVRALPSEAIKDIQTAENDIRQETFYIPQDLNVSPYPAYSPLQEQSQFIVHYAVNRPVGCKFGESDLAPMLTWIGWYSAWLEDRARLNRFRQAFMFILRDKYANKAERDARQNEGTANPPPPGSILVTDESESWGVLLPELSSFEAGEDGLSLKKMIAVGAGIPVHYLGEPESSTRTTAEAAGTPTFRGLEQTQTGFLRFLIHLLQIAIKVRVNAMPREMLKFDSVDIAAPDITEKDNAVLALAVSRIYPVLSDLFDRDGMDEAEVLRLVYRMAGETFDEDARVPKMRKKPLTALHAAAAGCSVAELAVPANR